MLRGHRGPHDNYRPGIDRARDPDRADADLSLSPCGEGTLSWVGPVLRGFPDHRADPAYGGDAGVVVAVPEIFHELEPAGTVFAYDEAGAARGNRHKITKTLSSYDNDARAALDYLASSPHCTGKLGVMGICIGGHLAFRAAMQSDVLAAACFYATDIHKRSLGQGMRDDSLDRIGEISGELLMIWGRQDPHIPQEGRALIYNALSDAGAHFQWHEFNAAHAFMRDEGPRYDPAAARICYDMTLELFHRRLGEGGT